MILGLPVCLSLRRSGFLKIHLICWRWLLIIDPDWSYHLKPRSIGQLFCPLLGLLNILEVWYYDEITIYLSCDCVWFSLRWFSQFLKNCYKRRSSDVFRMKQSSSLVLDSHLGVLQIFWTWKYVVLDFTQVV